MDFGVIILSVKKPAYSMAAFNLALSIKYFNPEINITLVSDGEHEKHFNSDHYDVFDLIRGINLCDYIDSNGSFQPGLAKLNIYKYTPYKRTLYIDADSLVLQDIAPLFDKLKGQSFKSNVVPTYTQWTDSESFKSFFGFDFGLTINSSWVYFESNEVFKKANEYFGKRFDLEKISPKWGKTFPDELFFNAAIQALKIDPKIDFDVMFFGSAIDPRTLTELENNYFAFTLYGGNRTVRQIYTDWYNKLLFKICTSKNINHVFKSDLILKGKHANK